jgi:hypothetical protein
VRLLLDRGANKEAKDEVRAPRATAAARRVGARRLRRRFRQLARVQPCPRAAPPCAARLMGASLHRP